MSSSTIVWPVAVKISTALVMTARIVTLTSGLYCKKFLVTSALLNDAIVC